MSIRSISFVALTAVFTVASLGCSNHVTREEYNRDVMALKTYTDQLEKEAADLRKYRQAYESLKDQVLVDTTEASMLENLRTALLRTLQGMEIGTADVQYDPKTGKWTMAGDLLFSSGSWTISKKGEAVLKTFCQTYKGKEVGFRIVGHTDRDPIAKATTKRKLHTDSNVELGAIRATVVYMTLRKFGLTGNNMFIESWGNNLPVAPNDNRASNKKKNRRVEIYILPPAVENPNTK